MGMFDWINCDYPLPGGKELVVAGKWDDGQYQTKDLDNGCDVYRITEDGRLLFEKWGEWSDDRTGQFIDHTGNVSFYGGGDGMRDVYTAVFSGGEVERIVDGWRTPRGPSLTMEELNEFVVDVLPKFNRYRDPYIHDLSVRKEVV